MLAEGSRREAPEGDNGGESEYDEEFMADSPPKPLDVAKELYVDSGASKRKWPDSGLSRKKAALLKKKIQERDQVIDNYKAMDPVSRSLELSQLTDKLVVVARSIREVGKEGGTSGAQIAALKKEVADLKAASKGYEDLWKEAEAKNKEYAKKLAEAESDREYFRELCQSILDIMVTVKDFAMGNLLKVRLESARDFLKSVAYKMGVQLDKDESRSDGFALAIGQCAAQGWIPADANLENLGISESKDVEGQEIPDDQVPNDLFYADEFVELIDEDCGDKKKHKGPYLPSWVPEFLKKVCFTPFESFEDFHKGWYALPGPVAGDPEGMNYYETYKARALEVEKEQELADKEKAEKARQGQASGAIHQLLSRRKNLEDFSEDPGYVPESLCYVIGQFILFLHL